MAITAEYGSSAAMVSVTAVVVSAMAVPTGRDLVRCCQMGTRMQPATAMEISDQGW